jgi:5-methylcytosine-specific restriction endonuclease McrA
MIPVYIDRVSLVQKHFENKIKKQRLNAIKKLKEISATGDDEDYLNKVITLFVNNEDILLWTPEKIEIERSLISEVPRIIAKNKKGEDVNKKSGIQTKIIEALGYARLRQTFYPAYFKKIGIKACVYCNSKLTVSAERPNKLGLSAKFDVDHYHSKTDYPFLSICLFNLYPACAPCNRAKSKSENIEFILYSKYTAETEKSLYEFKLTSESKAKYLLNKNAEAIQFTFHEPPYSAGKKKFDEVFHVKGIYETQIDIVEELICKSQMYNTGYIDLLKENFKKLALNPELFRRMLIGNYAEDKDIHKRPLSKFTMDIAKQLDII